MLPRIWRHPTTPLYLTIGFSVIPVGLGNTIIPLYVLSLGGTAADWGLLFAAFAFALGVGEIVIGSLSDRLGIRVPMTISRLASALTTGVFALLPGLNILYLLMVLRGFAGAAIWPLGKSHIGRTVPSAQKGTFLGLFYTMVGLGSSLGSIIGGLIVDQAGFAPAFIFALVFSVLAAAIGWAGIAEAPEHAAERPKESPVRAPLRVGRLAAVGAVTIVVVAGWMATTTSLPIIATTEVGIDPAGVGLIMGGFGLTITALGVPLGRLGDRIGRRLTIIIGLTIMVGAMAGLAFAMSFWTLMLTAIAVGVALSMTNPARVALLSDVMPAGSQGAAMGWIGGFEDLGMVIGGGLTGVLLTNAGRGSAFAAIGAGLLIGIVICLLFVREREWHATPNSLSRSSAGTLAQSSG